MFLIISSTLYVLGLRHEGEAKDGKSSTSPTPLYDDEEQQMSSLNIPMDDLTIKPRKSREVCEGN